MNSKKPAGFTIVELLIVIVVIAILAAIAIVSYNGITNRTRESVLKSDLQSGATQLGVTQAESGSYPTDGAHLKKSDGTVFQYTRTSDTAFCLSATNSAMPGTVFHLTNTTGIEPGLCPNDVPIAGTMQSFTPSQCTALTTFTGSNNEAVIGLTDSRGGITRTYHVAKLADNKCWMLTNLKLGSTTSTTPLTPSDSNVASAFTLPQIITSGVSSYDMPQAIGPVPGDTGSGATNYGYLYNWSAATAGETRTTKPVSSGDAQYSICPAGWRLPSGGTSTSSNFAQLDIAFGGNGGYTYNGQPSYPQWQTNGPFKTVFSGSWVNSSFGSLNSFGAWWTRTVTEENTASGDYAHETLTTNAEFGVVFTGSQIAPRLTGNAIRCLLD